MTDPADHWKLAWDFCDEEHAYDETDEERHRCTRCIGLKAQFDRIAERAYQNGAASHVEHHKCARCYDAGVAQGYQKGVADAMEAGRMILDACRAPSAPSEVK